MLRRGTGLATVFVVLLAWGGVTVWCLWPRPLAALRVGEIIEVPDPTGLIPAHLAFLVLLAGLLSALLMGALRRVPHRWERRVQVTVGQIALVFVPTISVGVLLHGLMSSRVPAWKTLGATQVAGTRYLLQMRLRDEILAFGVEVAARGRFARTKVLAVAEKGTESTEVAWPSPADPKVGRGEARKGPDKGLLVAPSGKWIVLVYPQSVPDNAAREINGPRHTLCWIDAAYDTTRRVLLTGPALTRISPFVLLSPGDKVDRWARESMISEARSHLSKWSSRTPFSASTLLPELHNPNPRVRALVAEMLGYYREEPRVPPALRRAAQDPVAGEQAAAVKALHRWKSPEGEE